MGQEQESKISKDFVARRLKRILGMKADDAVTDYVLLVISKGKPQSEVEEDLKELLGDENAAVFCRGLQAEFPDIWPAQEKSHHMPQASNLEKSTRGRGHDQRRKRRLQVGPPVTFEQAQLEAEESRHMERPRGYYQQHHERYEPAYAPPPVDNTVINLAAHPSRFPYPPPALHSIRTYGNKSWVRKDQETAEDLGLSAHPVRFKSAPSRHSYHPYQAAPQTREVITKRKWVNPELGKKMQQAEEEKTQSLSLSLPLTPPREEESSLTAQ